MKTGDKYNLKDQYQEGYIAGFEDAIGKLEKKVKKLGKKHYKDFLLHLKYIENGKYLSSTFTNHECNCFFCDFKDEPL